MNTFTLLRFVVFALFLAAEAIASDPPAKPECSALWQSWTPYIRFTDNPGKPGLIAKVVENVQRSINEVFAPAVKNWGQSADRYTEILKAQHQIVTDGYGGFYQIHAGGSSGARMLSIEAKPGVFLANSSTANLYAENGIIKMQPYISPDCRVPFSEVQKRQSRFPEKIQIEWVPDEMLPENTMALSGESRQFTWEHHYPNLKYLDTYLFRLKELMGLVLKQDSQSEFLKYLADYYHAAINFHFFQRGNNSLFMSQVNYLLTTHGFKPVAHESLDYWALLLHYYEFREEFSKHVMKYQGL